MISVSSRQNKGSLSILSISVELKHLTYSGVHDFRKFQTVRKWYTPWCYQWFLCDSFPVSTPKVTSRTFPVLNRYLDLNLRPGVRRVNSQRHSPTRWKRASMKASRRRRTGTIQEFSRLQCRQTRDPCPLPGVWQGGWCTGDRTRNFIL